MLTLLITLLLVVNGNLQETGINKGRDNGNQYPYVFRIEKEVRNNYLLQCSGNLVDEKWIFTSGSQINSIHVLLSVSQENRTNKYCSEYFKVLLRIVHVKRPVFYDVIALSES